MNRQPEGDRLDEHAGEVLGILSRAAERGTGAMGEPQIASEIGLDERQVGTLLHRLQHDGRVDRTADGSWEATPATQATTAPRPSPKEPPQA